VEMLKSERGLDLHKGGKRRNDHTRLGIERNFRVKREINKKRKMGGKHW